ncbi:MAG TPA: gliding motility-associated protein GldE [Salinivirgaceae bacterium]|nr:gliding motility-associated protein GldE [Salinivirgaceae bacterium]
MDIDPSSVETTVNSVVLFSPDIILGIFLVLFFLILSGLISGTESALFSLTPSDIDSIRKKNPSKGDKIAKLLQHPHNLLGTILISNNMVNISIVLISTYLTNQFFDLNQNPLLSFLIQIIGITFFLLIFGEIIPKVFASARNHEFALYISGPLFTITKLLGPLSKGLSKSTRIIHQKVQPSETISPEDLSKAIELTRNVSSDEEEILKGLVEISSIEASEIMRPRVDLVTIEIKTKFHSLLNIVQSSGYSRLPVYHESLDNIKGILYIKDLLPYLDKPDSFAWQSLIRPPYFVPKNKPINDLLTELQEKHIHMAIVVDEYGGTSGIVTLEDIIEEIIGDISDEYDEEEYSYTKVNQNTFIFEGKTSINDFCRILNYEGDLFNDVNADTLAGFILEQTGEMPRQYDVIRIDPFEFKIEAVDHRRIKKIQVTLLNSESTQ